MKFAAVGQDGSTYLQVLRWE